MNWDMIQGFWQRSHGKARMAWGEHFDDAQEVVEGRREDLARRIQIRYEIEKRRRRKSVFDSDELEDLERHSFHSRPLGNASITCDLAAVEASAVALGAR